MASPALENPGRDLAKNLTPHYSIQVKSYVTIGTQRKDGKTVLICGGDIPVEKQTALLKGIAGQPNEEFSEIRILDASVFRKRVRFDAPVKQEQTKPKPQAAK